MPELTLAKAEEVIRESNHRANEVEAMALLARRERARMLAEREFLLADNMKLRHQVGSWRGMRAGCRTTGLIRPAASDRCSSTVDNMYDWVCEIGKLSDVGTEGWKVHYSEDFFASMTDDERRYVIGSEAVSAKEGDADTDHIKGQAGPHGWDLSLIHI